MKDMTFKQEIIYKNNKNILLSRCVALPGERIFILGGASTPDCETVFKTNYELAGEVMVEKAPMWAGRAGFGCAVYPNFS
jgi:hypothetical protein